MVLEGTENGNSLKSSRQTPCLGGYMTAYMVSQSDETFLT